MSLPVPLVVGHHQGDGPDGPLGRGAPSDAALEELATPLPGRGRYTYGIGVTRWTRYLDDPTAPYPGGDASTGGHNRTSLGIVLTGNRSVYPLTLADEVMLGEIGRDARARGFVGPAPTVLAHRAVPGNFTECCGDLVAPPFASYPGDADAWLHFVSAFLGAGPAPSPSTTGEEMIAATSTGKGYWIVDATGAVFAFGDARYMGGANAKPLNAPITGIAPLPDDSGYWLTSKDGGVFAFGAAKYYGNAIGKVHN